MGGYKYTAGGGGAPAAVNATWTQVDIADGTWSRSDWQNSGSNITSSGGTCSVELSTANSNNVVSGCVFYKELKTADGSDFVFGAPSPKPVDVRGYIHLPETSWQDTGGGSGGGGYPAVASRCYITMGIMSDPDNLPTGPTGPWPKDLVGTGIEYGTSATRIQKLLIRNNSNSGTYGSITATRSGLNSVTATDVSNGRHWMNRWGWAVSITPDDLTAAGALTPVGSPLTSHIMWDPTWDNGQKVLMGAYSASQRWRHRQNKLYVWISCGRGNSASSSATIKFKAFYHARILDGGTNPSGTTQLT